jgi:SOS response regulatory protein OraA/RecX
MAEQTKQNFSGEERFLLQKALSRLACHDDTPRRLLERLLRLKYQGEEVSREAGVNVVRFLVREGLLREKAYAKDLVSALKSRGYGTRRILQELKNRKFSEGVVADVRASLEEEDGEAERAFFMLSRRSASRRSDLSDRAEVSRLYAYLSRLGFSPDVCKQALNKLKAEDEEA